MPSQPSPGKSLLVVEDNDVTREGLAVVLRRAGYQVALAGDGEEALDYLRGEPLPDLILLDMLMSGVDGWEFLQRRKRDPALAALPVIIMTALGVASDEWATSLGATGWLHKPVEADDLLAAVRGSLAES
jgi:putative two-component system response regulator